jgi:predicted nucleic acid-binding protein
MQPSTTGNLLCLDTSYLVGFFDEDDLWHDRAMEIYTLIEQRGLVAYYFDCVLNELLSVLARRCRERRRSETFGTMVDRLNQAVPRSAVIWIYTYLPDWFNRCVAMMRDTQGRLNFHDCLIAIATEEFNFSALVSFDTGFDTISTVNRLGSASAVAAWIGATSTEPPSPSAG